jgi:hypothetical protein
VADEVLLRLLRRASRAQRGFMQPWRFIRVESELRQQIHGWSRRSACALPMLWANVKKTS